MQVSAGDERVERRVERTFLGGLAEHLDESAEAHEEGTARGGDPQPVTPRIGPAPEAQEHGCAGQRQGDGEPDE
ncbi:hypothetical protein GCM10025876_23060 [Demequina litorisediminis]|uniref:Uncharacterized protein n=1 Tax=Demequina litorisediminis TaxID=1849022 RepID=A0ABQ6IE09_9MICO|nr:hypothetical protein GCM10025876_23060 [Demequina litorisediminis]